MKVAVIGAGAAGLVATKHAVEFGCEVIAFEQSNKIGGTWVYTNEVGKNEFDIDIHSSMYKDLTTNLPIELMCYPNEPFPDDETSFVSSEVVLRYYESFAAKYQLHDHIKFQHQVIQVRPLTKDLAEGWEVIVRNVPVNKFETYVFDAILVCTGHFCSGFIPMFEGRKIFQGRQMHSHDYRFPEAFKDETVLVIGGKFSAVDIVQQTSRQAKSVTWSHHLKDEPNMRVCGNNIIQKPDVLKIRENYVVFMDHSSAKFTTIIYCTGYEYKYLFLSVDCGISTSDDFVSPLYKHCLNINRPSMGFIGIANLVCPNQLFSLQSRFCLSFIVGTKTLPSKKEMFEDYEMDLKARLNRGLQGRKIHLMGPNVQGQYYLDLAMTAGIEPIKPVMPRMHAYTSISRNKNFLTFRNNKFYIIDEETFEVRPI